jgi:hypothetical protein
VGALAIAPSAAIAAQVSESKSSLGAKGGKSVKPVKVHVRLAPSKKSAGKAAKSAGGARKAAQATDFGTPTANFDGMNGDLGDSYYPDHKIDVGPEHVVETISSHMAVYSKSGTLLGDIGLPEFFEVTGDGTPCSAGLDEEGLGAITDAQPFYDTATDRWIIVTQAYTDADVGPWYTCIASSNTGNPLDTTWNFSSIKYYTSGDVYPQTITYGLWKDGLYMAADLYCLDLTSTTTCPFTNYASTVNDPWGFVGTQLWGFNRADILDGSAVRWQTTIGNGRAPSPTNCAASTAPAGNNFNPCYWAGLRPATYKTQTGAPPDGRGEYFVSDGCFIFGETNILAVWRWTVNWNTPASSVVTAPQLVGNNVNGTSSISSTACAAREDIPSPTGAGNALYSWWDNLTGRINYTSIGGSEALWVTHSYENPTAAATIRNRVHWTRLSINSGSGALNTTGATGNPGNQFQTGTNRGANWPTTNDMDRWNVSSAIDKNGNAALAYQTMNGRATQPPLSRLAFRYVGGTNASMNSAAAPGATNQTEATVIQGNGYQVGTIDGEVNTWVGPETATVLDPDGCTFWTVGQYFEGEPATLDDVLWKTRIASFGFPAADCTRDLLATQVSASGLAPSVGADTGVLKATLTATGTGSGIGGKTIAFELGGNPVGNAVTNNKGVATLSGVDVSSYSVGTASAVVKASFAGTTDTYGASSTSPDGDLAIKGNTAQAITFDALGDKTFGDADFNVSATSDSALAVSFSASGKCSVTGTLVHIKGAGSCTITASQAGDDTYAAATDVPQSFSIAKANQSISLTALGASNNVGQVKQATVASATPANRSVDWSSNGNCAVKLSRVLNGAQITSTHAGTCEVTVTLPGDANYNAASDMGSFVVGKGTQTGTLTYAGNNSTTRRIDQIGHQVVNTWNSGLSSSTFVAENAGPWSVTAATGTGTAATLTLSPTAHTMQVGTRVTINGMSNAAYDGTYTLTAVAANTITYASAATGAATGPAGTVTQALTVCSNVGNDVTVAHTGACKITMTQDGNDDWNPGSLTRTVGITKGNQGNQTFAPAGGAGNPRPIADGDFNVTASLNAANTAANPELLSSGLSPGTLSSTTGAVCTVGSTTNNGDGTATVTVTPIAGGTCTISAAGNAGNNDWNNRTAQTISYTITKTNQTIDFASLPDKHITDDPFEVSATATSGLDVSFSSLTESICTVAGTTVTLTGSEGVCTIRASQAGNGVYNAAPNVDRSFEVIDRDPQSIDFPDQTDRTVGDADFDPGATASSNLEVSYTSLTTAVCTIVDNKVHLVKNGTCTVQADQDGDFYFLSAEAVSKSFTVFTTPKINLKYVKPKKNVTWGGNVKATVKATAKSRKPSGLVTFYIAPKGSDEWVESGTLNYISGKKSMYLNVTAPCGPSKGKYQLTVSFTDSVGSQQTVWFKKPMGKPFQLKASGVC